MQEGRTKNIGWSVYFDVSRENISMLYHVEEDKDRLCGQMCCQKKNVLFTHPNKDIAEKFLKDIRDKFAVYQYSKEVINMRAEIKELNEQKVRNAKNFLWGNLENVKDNMLEYLI